MEIDGDAIEEDVEIIARSGRKKRLVLPKLKTERRSRRVHGSLGAIVFTMSLYTTMAANRIKKTNAAW